MWFGGPICVTVPNFAKIGQTVPEIWPNCDFQHGGRPPSWIFNSGKLRLPVRFWAPIFVILPNFAKIGRTVPEIWPIFDFSRWRQSAILDLFYACWDHPRRVLGGLCDCAKFGCNRCSNFDSVQILIFCTLSLKMPIHAPKIGVFGGFYPQNGEQGSGVSKPQGVKIWPFPLLWLFAFTTACTTVQAVICLFTYCKLWRRAKVDRLWRSIRHMTCFRPRMCLLGSRSYCSPFWG